MTWLTPLAGAILAAIVIPPLILLYFLKLRRRPQAIASTLLWKRAIEDLRANAPFQRLRRSLLLLLQLIVLALLVLSIMQPQIQADQRAGGKTVLLIDNSASMTATDAPEGRTRLDEAKRLARGRIEELYAGGLFAGSPGQTMIIAFSDRAEIYSRFTDSKQQLLNATDRIQPTHGGSEISEALKLARAYTINPNPDQAQRPQGDPAALELFSDGRITDLAQQVLRGETMLHHMIGSPQADNVAISNLAVERPYDRPTAVEVFVTLLNFNREPTGCTLELSVNGDLIVGGLQDRELPAAEVDATTNRLVPGRSNVVFTPFDQPRDAVIEVHNLRGDDLAADNYAQVVVPPAKRLSVALVDSQSMAIQWALEGMALERLDLLRADRFAQLASQGGLDTYDVVVLDDHAPLALPRGRYFSLGLTPLLDGLNEFGVKSEHQLILDAKWEHPLLRFVDLTNVLFQGAHLLQPADDVTVLAEATGGAPAIIEVNRPPVHVLHVTFSLDGSNFPFERSFPTFIYNAVDYLGHYGEAITSEGFAPGEAITARLPAGARELKMHLPSGPEQGEPVEAPDPTSFSWGPARVSGLHVLSWAATGGGERESRPFAVNLFSETEGDIQPQPAQVGQDPVQIAEGGDAYQPLWPWALGLCLAVLMLEWWVYHRKTYV